MNIVESIQYLFPDAVIGKDIVLVDLNGDGNIEIVGWNLNCPRPTSEQLTAASAAATKSAASKFIVQTKNDQLAVIDAACAAAITGGFQSSALGKAYTYPSQQTDQSNLAANVLSSIYPNLPANWTTLQICCDAKGVWAYPPHTAAQIQQVGTDGKTAILSCLTKKVQLQTQIFAAQSVQAVQSINW